MKKVVDTVFVLFNIIAIVLTLYLLNINDQKICKVGNYSIVSLQNDVEDTNLSMGTLLITKLENPYEVGTSLLYTKNNSNTRYTQLVTIEDIATRNGKNVYILSDGIEVEETKLNGTVESSIKIPYLGYVINFFEKENVYIVTIVIPLFALFVYQFVFQSQSEEKEIKKAKKNKNKSNVVGEVIQTQKQKEKKEIAQKEKLAREKFENIDDEKSFNELKEIEKQYIKLLKYGNDINDIDINEYYKTR